VQRTIVKAVNKPNKVIVLIGSKVQGDRPYKDDRPTKYTIGSADLISSANQSKNINCS